MYQEIPYTNDNTLPARVIDTEGHQVHRGPRFPYVFLREGVVYHVKEDYRQAVTQGGSRIGDFVLREGNVFTVSSTGSCEDLVRIKFMQNQ
jgi:hypothetical protein